MLLRKQDKSRVVDLEFKNVDIRSPYERCRQNAFRICVLKY